MAVVIDTGTSAVPDARCFEVNASVRNGAEFLAARAQILNTPPPTYDRSGLLCSIDGYPATGCGEQTGNSYAYWSYWDGRSGSWVFSNTGPASRRMTNSSVAGLSLIHISEPTRLLSISYAVFCLTKKNSS